MFGLFAPRRGRWSPLAFALLVIAACGGLSSMGEPDACSCSIEPPQSAAQPATCDTSYLPDTTCCAAPNWPANGDCSCVTSAIFCGFVPGYFRAADGGAGQDGCICSVGPEPITGATQAMGATCYPNATTAAGPGLGTCCMFPASAPGTFGIPLCGCATGLDTCSGGTPVDSCSAASFPRMDTSCGGDTLVARCK